MQNTDSFTGKWVIKAKPDMYEYYYSYFSLNDDKIQFKEGKGGGMRLGSCYFTVYVYSLP